MSVFTTRRIKDSALEFLAPFTQLSETIVLRVTVAMVSLVVLTRSATAQTKEGNPGPPEGPGRSPLCEVQVETADGKPLTNATVVGVSTATNAYLNGTTIGGGDERFQTDGEGRFSLAGNDTNIIVTAAKGQGFSLAHSMIPRRTTTAWITFRKSSSLVWMARS
jgi:hypothetical protein